MTLGPHLPLSGPQLFHLQMEEILRELLRGEGEASCLLGKILSSFVLLSFDLCYLIL